jgi:hypothetical protein
MAATVRVNEYNTGSETATNGITNSNYGSVDSANLNPNTNPVGVGTNSFEKWQKLEVTAMGGASSIQNIRVWRDGALTGSDSLKTNARTSSYGGAETFATPTDADSTVATQEMPSSLPSSANLGIAGSLAGQLTSAGYSDYLVHQLQLDPATIEGASVTINWRYTEIA